ncbi:MAG TPA: phenylalanine--tRNA ligase subunit beta [Candidatus Microsaccharimonas sp.]|nr:phenylalanine--tRNA ligase subunit beta [Candidatus Microsaccharimonas sp.]
MKISLNWMREFGGQGLDVPTDELVRRIGAQLGAVEEVENLGAKYQGIVIAKIVSCVDHPNADRLHICTIDDGGITPDVKRDANGHVQVVCGAPNAREGITVAWLPPGATVPDSVGTGDPFVLEARELRGVVSNGMLASPKELALGENHDGILEIDPTQWTPSQMEIKPGADFAKVFGLDDMIIDIENKMFTHRPDCFGQLGVAREIAGISGQQFISPRWYSDKPQFPNGDGLALEVVNESPELVPRLMTLTMKNVKIAPSPLWLQCALIRVGAKPINNVVDVTNYIMLLTAQPTHAYDYDKLRGHKLVARMAKPGEKALLLNHKTYEFDPADIVIADGEGPIGLAGIMGGGDSEVSDETTNIVLECANFDMYNVRRSSMRHGIFTDALTRFNKGQSPLQNDHVLHLLMQSVQDVAGGEAAGQVTDINSADGREWVHPPVPVTVEFVNARLGFDLSADDMKQLLENVEFRVDADGDKLTVMAPFWRTDVETREDVVEEIGRLYGFDKLPLVLPERDIVPAHRNDTLQTKAAIRAKLKTMGANEVLTYSFVHGNLLDKMGQNKAQAFSLSNALSPDLQYYRLSLTPSLLDKVHMNAKAGYDAFALFEIGTVHGQGEVDEDGLPKGMGRVSLVYANTGKQQSTAYYQARTFASELLAEHLDIGQIRFVPIAEAGFADHKLFQQMIAPYDDGRAAVLLIGERPLGVVGEFKPSVAKAIKLPKQCAGFELFLSAFKAERSNTYQPLSRFPSVTQDITLKITTATKFEDVANALQQSLSGAQSEALTLALKPLGIYQSPDDGEHKNISFRLVATSYQKTLKDAEVNDVLEAAAHSAQRAVGAERI